MLASWHAHILACSRDLCASVLAFLFTKALGVLGCLRTCVLNMFTCIVLASLAYFCTDVLTCQCENNCKIIFLLGWHWVPFECHFYFYKYFSVRVPETWLLSLKHLSYTNWVRTKTSNMLCISSLQKFKPW